MSMWWLVQLRLDLGARANAMVLLLLALNDIPLQGADCSEYDEGMQNALSTGKRPAAPNIKRQEDIQLQKCPDCHASDGSVSCPCQSEL